MIRIIFQIAGLITLILGVNSCNSPGCGNAGGAYYSNGGTSGAGQGVSAGRNINYFGAVNINGNNGSGIVATNNSVIKNLNMGTVIIQTGANSVVTSSGKDS